MKIKKELILLLILFIVPNIVKADIYGAPESFSYYYPDDEGDLTTVESNMKRVSFSTTTGDYVTYKYGTCRNGSSSASCGVEYLKRITKNESLIKVSEGSDVKASDFTNKPVYCSEWAAHTSPGDHGYASKNANYKYIKYSTSQWNPLSKYAIELGYAVHELEESIKDESASKKYIKIGTLINHYRSKNSTSEISTFSSKKTSGCYNGYKLVNNSLTCYSKTSLQFSKPADFITENIAAGKTEYQKIKNYITEKNLPDITVSTGSTTIKQNSVVSFAYNQTSNGNISYYYRTIDLKNLLTTHEDGSSVKYTVTVSGNAKICENLTSNASGCTSSLEISKASSKKIYIWMNNSTTPNTTVKLNINGYNKSAKYYTSYLYKSADTSSSYQNFLYPAYIYQERSSSTTFKLKVPSTDNYTISAIKVDASGNDLNGATLKLYKDGTELQSTTSGNTISWTSPRSSTSKEELTNSKFTVKEISAPSGYILTDDEIVIKEKGVSLDNSTTCYRKKGDEDSEALNSTEKCDTEFTAITVCVDKDNNIVADEKCTVNNTPTPDDENNNSTQDQEQTDSSTGTTTDDNEESEPMPTNEYSIKNACQAKKGSNDSTITIIEENTDSNDCAEDVIFYTVTVDGGDISISIQNNPNHVTISKQSITGEGEVAGAELKICAIGSDGKVDANCEATKNVNGEKLSWTSGGSPQTWYGLPAGNYAIVETVAPLGYIKPVNQINKFSIDKYGNVKLLAGGDATMNTSDKVGFIIIKNTLNNINISKTDIATSKELPGATLVICKYNEDTDSTSQSDGNDNNTNDNSSEFSELNDSCSPTLLADGSPATWVSSDKPFVITGISTGTYKLVEQIAPNGYSTAESIIFKVNEDGTVTDKDGKSLKDNKLLMEDKKIEQVKTGQFAIILVAIIGTLAAITAVYFSKKTKFASDNIPRAENNNKIRKRKIHK